MRIRIATAVLVTAVVLFPAAGLAQLDAVKQQIPARSTGMAGIGRSFANGGSALYLNPATLGVFKQYILGGGYSYLYSGEAEANAFSVEWTDSSPNPFNLGLGFGFNFIPRDSFDSHSYHGAMTYSVGSSTAQFHLGLGAHGLFNVGGLDANVWSGDVGVALDFSQAFRIGAVGYNLVREGDIKLPRGTGGGMSFWSGPFMIAADVAAMFNVPGADGKESTQVTYGGAIQLAPVNEVALRLGANHDTDPSTTRLAGGLSFFVQQAFGLTLGYQQALSDDTDILASVMLEVYNPFGPPQM